MLSQFKRELIIRLESNLPGHEAHRKVMSHRKGIHQLKEMPSNARQSAVLVLLYPKKNKIHTVLILRPTYQGVHSGQIGFPGGKVEKEDKGLLSTALREAKEELDIQAEKIEVVGALTPIYIPPSNFFVSPFIAIQESTPYFTPDRIEVEEVLETPVNSFMGEDKLVYGKVNTNTGALMVKGFQVNQRIIWGATGMMIKELGEVLEEITIPNELL